MVKIDVVGLHPQVELPLLGKVVAGHQLLGQRALDLIAQLGHQLPLGQHFALLTALGVQLPGHPLPQGLLACGIGGTILIAMETVDLQFNGQLPQRPGLNGLHKAGVPAQLQRRHAEELRPGPESLGPVDGQQFKVRVRDREELVVFHQFRVQRGKSR